MEPETGSGEFVSTAQSKYTDTCYSYYDYHETSGRKDVLNFFTCYKLPELFDDDMNLFKFWIY